MLEETDSSHPRLQPKDVRNKNGRWLLPWPHHLSPLSLWVGQLFTSIRENHKGKSLHKAMNTNMLENTGFPSEPQRGVMLQKNPWRWMDQTPWSSMHRGAACSYRICWVLGALTGDAGDTRSLNSRKITLAMMKHNGPCGSASKEESPGLPCRWDSTSQSLQGEERTGGSALGCMAPWAGTEQKRLHRWVVTSWALQGGLGVAVGTKTAEFSSSHYSLQSYSCWNTAGPEEVSIQEQIPTLFLKSYEAITALLCLLPDWEASCCVWKHSALLFHCIYKKMLNKKEV